MKSIVSLAAKIGIAVVAFLVPGVNTAQVISDLNILRVTVSAGSVSAYQPFTLTVVFDRELCVPQSALIAGARTETSRLIISIATLASQNVSCSATKEISWPGLPPGNYSVEVGMGRFSWYPAVNGSSIFALATSASTNLDVAPIAAVAIPVYLINVSDAMTGYAWRLERQTTNYATVGDGAPINISEATGTPPMAAFAAWPQAAGAVPTSDLYELAYTLAGQQRRYFYTTRGDERDKLVANGFTFVGSPFRVVAAVGEACATGLRPIYRLFHPTLLVHKFVGADTHAALAASGWISEKIAFCAAPDSERGTRWQPN